ncbi:hypothetical protein A2U01_0020981, partial [Trifolium medium]|nr:hypothetical protein [Trifolium medium]
IAVRPRMMSYQPRLTVILHTTATIFGRVFGRDSPQYQGLQRDHSRYYDCY